MAVVRLAVHRDIANVKAYAERDLTYRELCVMRLRDEPSLFLALWGLCFNDYRRRGLPRPYIVKKWRDAMFLLLMLPR